VTAPAPISWQSRLVALLDTQVVRFALVGVLNTAFAFVVFAALQITLGDRLHYMVILVVATIVGILEAYVMQRWLVFRVSGRWWRELVRFSSVYGVALGVNAVALPLLVEVFHVPVLPAQAIVMLATALGTFVVHRAFTFRRPPPVEQPGAADPVR
jgi:putative flippase GtrA